MNFQKFVAWEKLPTLCPEKDAQESSSSSSKTGSVEEGPPEIFQKAKIIESADAMTIVPIIEIPHSVKNVLNKIDTAQLERAKKDISKKLLHIQDKVNRVYEHYKKEDGFDPELEKEYLHTATWEERSRRSNLLDEIADSLDQSAFKEKELQLVLESFKAWSEMMRTIELQEKLLLSEDWIDEAEKRLLKRFNAVQKNILHLINVCYPLLQEREKMRQKSAARISLFKAWRDKVAEKPQSAEPLTAERMVEDEALTFSLINEVHEMILEIAELSFFNKGEVNAIKYIAALVANLSKAFGLLTRQCRSLKIKLEVGAAESRKQDPQITSLQRELRMIIEKKAALEMQVEKAEERCKVLLTTNEAMQKELQSAHERAQMKKGSFSRPSSGKFLQEKSKSQVDVEKDVSKTKPVKQPTASKAPSMETSSLEEMRKLKSESEDSHREEVMSVVSTTQSQDPLAQESQIKRDRKVEEKETTPQTVPRKSTEETSPLEKKTGLAFPIERVVESTKDLKRDRDPIAPQDPKLDEKSKLQTSQSATAKTVKESHLSQASGACSQVSVQETISEGEPSPQSLAKSVHTPSIKEDIKLSVKTEETQPPSTQWDGQPQQQKPSLKRSAQTIVQAIRFQKRVEFLQGLSAQAPSTAPESSEKLDTEFPEGSPSQKSLMGTAEGIEAESQDAGKMQAQEQQADGFKEKKETKGLRSILVEGPTDISETEAEKRKQAQIIRDVVHNLGRQLQEIAKEKGGALEEGTIKELFEELDMTSEEDGSEDIPADEPAKGPIVKKLVLHASASEPSSAPRESTDKASSGQDTKSALQEFQASILACIEDKLEKLEKFSSDSLKEAMKSQPTNPQVQHLYQEIDRKLDECFSAMKHKYRGAMMRRRLSGLGGEDKEVRRLSSLRSPSILSRDSSVSSTGVPEEGGEQQMPPKHHRLSKQRMEQLKRVHAEVQNQQKLRRKSSGLSKSPLSKEEKLPYLPEVVLSVQDEKSEEKEPPQQDERQSVTESDSEQGPWLLRLQERLEWEKDRLQEEQVRLQEEHLRLDEEEQYLAHWQQLFEMQQEQWTQQQQLQQQHECLWTGSLEYWQHLKQDHEEQQQYWWLQEEQHQERLYQLQEELGKLQQQYEEQLLLQKEQMEEQGRWEQLQAQREEQLQAWQEEDEEREKQRSQWQQQLADHEKQLEAWEREKAEQEAQFKKWQKEMQQQLQEQEHLWQQRSQEQQRAWQRQVQWHRIQQRKRQTQQQKVQESEKQIRNEENILAPKLQMLKTRVQKELAKEVQPQEVWESSPIKLEPPAHKVQLLPTAYMDDLLPAAHKAGPLPTSPQLSPEPSSIYLDSFNLVSTSLPKLFPRDYGFPASSITGKHYSLDVEAQRKNLVLLEEAHQKAELDSDLYIKAKETITQALHSNVERLALLFRKYIAFRRFQEIRRILTAQLDAAKDNKDSATVQKMYRFVEKLDAYQNKVLGNWTTGQKIVEKKRQHNTENMIVLFAQLRLNYQLQLNTPCSLITKGTGTPKETHPMPHIGPVYQRPKVYQSPLTAVKKPTAISAIARDESSEQIESLWQTDITELSDPLGTKTPVSLLWSRACGFPDIPRLLEFDITSLRNKPLQEIKTRIQSIPRWKLSEYKFMHL